jgi:enoyl-CoA hydratase
MTAVRTRSLTDTYGVESERLQLSVSADRIATLQFSHAPSRNAMDLETHREVGQILSRMVDDDGVDILVVTGTDEAFSSGGDFSMIKRAIDSVDERAAVLQDTRRLVYEIINFPKVIISAIEGPAVGAGLAVAMLADISIAAENARLIDGHTKLGVAAGDHAAIIWPLLCGMARAKHLLLTCEPVTGKQAQEIGLVSLSVPDGTSYARALELASSLQSKDVTAVRWTKWALNGWLRQSSPIFESALAYEFLGVAARHGTGA